MRARSFLLFILSWLTFGWFHQGGGWNQNARFAEVRAIVEQGRFAIDDFLIYKTDGVLRVRDISRNGIHVRDGVLCWQGGGYVEPVPVDGSPFPAGANAVVIGKDTSTGDIGYSPDGHFYSNKPPGTSLLAVPVYFIAYHLERALGWSPDHWWVINVNLWLCSLFTVSLASAICVVLVWQTGRDLFPQHPRAALAAALVFGFGTPFFPFGTLLFDHNLTAALLLGSFRATRADRPFLAGGLAGIAAVTNYLAAIPGVAFGVWALCRHRCHAWRYIVGVVPPAIALLTYNTVALGSPFTLNTSFQNPMFKETAPAFLGMFTLPSWFATQVITISPWRGIFVLAPALILAVAALFRWPSEHRAERRLIVGIAAFFFLINISFNGFHGGMAAGPRYLVPALPFLCIALVPAFAHWPIAGGLLSMIGIVQQFLLTVTDALNPVGITDHAWQNHPDEWKEKLGGNSIVWRYAWPVFSEGRAWPVIRAEFVENGPYRPTDASSSFLYIGTGETYPQWVRVLNGEPEPVPLAAMPGPVSMNVVSAFEGGFFQLSQPHSKEATWAAFNVGEFWLPESRGSVLPLLGIWVGAAFVAWRRKLWQ